MRALLITFLLFTSTAFAATAFKVGEEVTGLTKQCYYEFAGSRYTITVKSHQLCPLSIKENRTFTLFRIDIPFSSRAI